MGFKPPLGGGFFCVWWVGNLLFLKSVFKIEESGLMESYI